MAKPKEKVVKDNAERWLLTYADLMNLLLIFFIILYAMSQVDQSKFDALSEALKSVLGTSSGDSIIEKGTIGPNITNEQINYQEKNSNNDKTNKIDETDEKSDDSKTTEEDIKKVEEKKLEGIKNEVDKLIKESGLTGKVNISSEERGIKVSISSRMLFKSGSAKINPDVKPTINDIGEILLKLSGNYIRVEGHTDSRRINTAEFPSNWELSSARANTVLRLLVEKGYVKATSISSVGYGEFRPLVPNNSEENMAKNRRVDIVIMKNELGKSEAN